jgi:hypothetical protein
MKYLMWTSLNDNMNARLAKTRLGLIVIEFNVKVKKSLAKCPSFIVKEEIRNQVEHCSYRSF